MNAHELIAEVERLAAIRMTPSPLGRSIDQEGADVDLATIAPALARALKLAIEQRDEAINWYAESPALASNMKINRNAEITRAIEEKP